MCIQRNKNMIKRIKYYWFLAAVVAMTAILLCGCSKASRPFKINVELEGLGAQNVRVVYIDGNGGLVDNWVKCENNIFTIEGTCQNPSLLMVYNSMNMQIIRLIVYGGDKIEVKGKVLEQYSMRVKGSEVAEELNAFMTNHKAEYTSAAPYALNTAIENYVKDHPKSVVSTMLVLLDYNPPGNLQIDKLMSSIDDSAKPESLLASYNMVKAFSKKPVTSIRTLNMYEMQSGDFASARIAGRRPSMIFFWNKDISSMDRTNIIAEMQMIDSTRVQMLDVNIDPDSAGWYRTIKQDGTSWKHYWVPGSMMNSNIKDLQLNTSSTVIVTDSLGRQLYRGENAITARQTIEQIVGVQ